MRIAIEAIIVVTVLALAFRKNRCNMIGVMGAVGVLTALNSLLVFR